MRRTLALLAIAAPLGAAPALGALLPEPLDPDRQPSGFPRVGAPLFVDGGGPAGARVVWGSVDCARSARVRIARAGGDPGAAGNGARQASEGFRRLRVLDGDDFYGERCELGENDHRSSPTALYREGSRLITFLSLKPSKRFPLGRDLWQVMMQMKQSQPSDGGGDEPILALHAYDGRWRLHSNAPDRDADVWTAPATAGRWARFAFDVTYSTDPAIGSVRVSVDLNADGDALDQRERSGEIRLQTLKPEIRGGTDDGLAAGDSIPSHLRVGIYHGAGYRCHGYKCSVGVDNVGIYEPG